MELENKIKCVLMDFEINEITLQEAAEQILRLSDGSKSFYCLGDSLGESGKCDKQCDDCRVKDVLKQ